MKHTFEIVFAGVVCAVMLSSCGSKVDGKWTGTCKNLTFGASAPLSITLKQDGSHVRGMLVLGGQDLVGSGTVEGIISGNNIAFTSPGDGQLCNCINWEGTISGNSISGTYRVEPTAGAAISGVPVQTGSFNVSK